MDRKWRCKGTTACPRGSPGPFPAVCPCKALCAGIPNRVASVPLPAQETAVSRPVCRLCGEGCGALGPLEHKDYGGRKRCGIKRGGRAAPPPGSHRPAMRVGDGVPGGGTILASGVRFASAWPELPAAAEVFGVPGGDTAQNQRNGGVLCPERKSSSHCGSDQRRSSLSKISFHWMAAKIKASSLKKRFAFMPAMSPAGMAQNSLHPSLFPRFRVWWRMRRTTSSGCCSSWQWKQT